MEGSFFYDVRCNEASAEWPVNRFANRSILRPRTGRRPSRPKIISNSWRASWTVSFIATLPTIERGTGDLQTKKPRAPVIRSSICYAWRTREGEFLRSSVPFRSKLFVDEYLSNVTWTALPIHRSWSIVVFRDAFHSSESSFQILSRNGLTNMLVVLESMGGRLEIRKTSLTIDFSRCSRDVCPYLSLSFPLFVARRGKADLGEEAFHEGDAAPREKETKSINVVAAHCFRTCRLRFVRKLHGRETPRTPAVSLSANLSSPSSRWSFVLQRYIALEFLPQIKWDLTPSLTRYLASTRNVNSR